MLTDGDIEKLYNRFLNGFSGVFATKTDLENFRDEMREDFQKLQTSVDGFAKMVETHEQELAVISNHLERDEKHIKQIADHIDFNLEY